MTDRYERIRAALAMGPTPGPWGPSYDKGSTRDIFNEQGKLPICTVLGITYVGKWQYLANGHFIAACDPDTIREMLAERDQLAAALEAAREDAERYRWLADNVESLPYPDMWRDKEWLDAAIDQARGKGVQGA